MIMEPEARRCRKTDGKKWRCSKEVLPEQKYCERHIHRRRKYTRKHYSEASIDSINVTVTTTNLSKSLPNPPLQTATISSLVDNVKKNANVNDMDKKESGNDSSLIAIGQNFSSDCNSSRSKFNLETMNKGVKSSANVAALVIGFPSRRNLHGGGATSITRNNKPRLTDEKRCRRTDGKKWRCNLEVVTNQKYCITHMHRGAKRMTAVGSLSEPIRAEINTRLSISPATMNVELTRIRRRSESGNGNGSSSSDDTTITDENGCICP